MKATLADKLQLFDRIKKKQEENEMKHSLEKSF